MWISSFSSIIFRKDCSFPSLDLLEKTLMLGKIEGRKGRQRMRWLGWHHQLDGLEFEQALGVGDEQGSLACCSPWGCKEKQLSNWTELSFPLLNCGGALVENHLKAFKNIYFCTLYFIGLYDITTVLITVTLALSLKSGSVSPSTLFFFFKIIVPVCLWCFKM